MRTVVFWSLLFLYATLPAAARTIRVAFPPGWGAGWNDPRLVYHLLAGEPERFGCHQFLFQDLAQPVTYAGLEAAAPDVVVLCNPSGGDRTYQTTEGGALASYLADHDAGLVGTYKFNHSFFLYDNSFLMDLFGVDGSFFTYDSQCTTGIYVLQPPRHEIFSCLFGDRFTTAGYPCSQAISAPSWDDAMAGADIIAGTTDDNGIIAVREIPWRSVYCSTMPDYCDTTTGDPWLVYAMLVWAAGYDTSPALPACGSAAGLLLAGVVSGLLLACRKS
ncbi:hypothetical protein JW905_02280 [bacterium]|nr:hypothetical protein [candidate division CSSED10-310 bacterium]